MKNILKLSVLLAATALTSGALAGGPAPVVIPAGSSTGPVPATPGTGLAANLWRPSATGNLATNVAFTQNNPANASFTATSVNYPRVGNIVAVGDTLANFLGNDAASVVGLDPTTTSAGPNIIRFTGFIAFSSPGTFAIGVGSDDGFDLRIGNTDVGRFDGERGFGFTYSNIEVSQAGLYPIELFYWANGAGESGVELAWDVNDNATFDPEIVPTASLYIPAPSAASALALAGLLAARRRR